MTYAEGKSPQLSQVQVHLYRQQHDNTTRIEAFVYHPLYRITLQEKAIEAIIMPCDYIPLSSIHHGMLLEKRPGVIIPVIRRRS